VPLSPKLGEWTRFHVTVKDDLVSVTTTDRQSQAPTKQKRGPLGLEDTSGPLQFMNLYARELR
jgi:hypothetical protein